jgi:hypothetical protein
VIALGAKITPSFSDGNAEIRVSNAFKDTIFPNIDWGDGTRENGIVREGTEASYKHALSARSGTVRVTYAVDGVPYENAFPWAEKGFIEPETASSPAEAAAPSVESGAVASESVASQPEKRGFLSGLLSWFANLFS